jgi:phytoene synthase
MVGRKQGPAERLTRSSGSSFAYALRILPRPKREAMYALYAFCRVVDDCVDEDDGEGEAGLRRWSEEIRRCYAGRPETPLGAELAGAVARFPIPEERLQEIVEGCGMDLAERRYASYADLEVYCRRVASAVGLAAIEIFGYRDPATRDFAVHLGLALQLTNILRDVAADAARGRLYLPLEDLTRFGVAEDEVMRPSTRGARRPEVDALLAFDGGRALAHYAAADAILPKADRRSMCCARVMGGIYRGILDELARRAYPVGEPRVRLSWARQAAIAARTLAASMLGQ